MIHISTRRAGVICLAATVHGDLDVTQSWGITCEAAARRLIRRLHRRDVEGIS